MTIGGPPGSLARYGVSHLVLVRGLQIDGFTAVWPEDRFGARST